MKHIQKTVAWSFLLIFILTGARITHAQSDAIKTARETVIENLTDIQTAKDNTLLTPAEKLKKELSLKQEALSNLCLLSILETKDIRIKLENSKLIGSSEPFEPLRIELIDHLIKYEKYFTSLRELVPATENIDDLRILANQFEEKRAVAYNADLKKAVDLLLVLQIDATLDKAFDRLDKVSAAVKRARGTKTEYATRVALINNASIHLTNAKSASLSAHNKIAAYLIPADAPIKEKTMLSQDVLPIETEMAPHFSARDHIEQSITLIKEAYKDLIVISDSLAGIKKTSAK